MGYAQVNSPLGNPDVAATAAEMPAALKRDRREIMAEIVLQFSV